MSSKATELLELLERKNIYKELYNTDSKFKSNIDLLKSRLDLMNYDSKKYPYDEIDYSYGRYLVFLYESLNTYYGDVFWRIDNTANIVVTKYEISEDLKYFKIDDGNSISVYNFNKKVLRK